MPKRKSNPFILEEASVSREAVVEKEDGELVDLEDGELVEPQGIKHKTIPKNKLQKLQAEADIEAKKLADGTAKVTGFRCPLCSTRVARNTKDDLSTNFWCPNKCLLPWQENNAKAAYYAELSVRIDSLYQMPTGKPPLCSHESTMRLTHLKGSELNELLQDSLFFICEKKITDGRCTSTVFAECAPGEKATFMETLFRNRNTKLQTNEELNVAVAEKVYEEALKKSLEKNKQRKEKLDALLAD